MIGTIGVIVFVIAATWAIIHLARAVEESTLKVFELESDLDVHAAELDRLGRILDGRETP